MVTQLTNKEINISAETLVGSFMNTNFPAGKEVLKEAKQLFRDNELTSGEIRKKLVRNRGRHL
jgi:hypothetical protein